MGWLGVRKEEQPFIHTVDAGEVAVPVDDRLAAWSNPKHRWVYDKSKLYGQIGMRWRKTSACPLGPCVLKRTMNLSSRMHLGTRLIGRGERAIETEGLIAMPLVQGAEYSIDLAVLRGQPIDWWVCEVTPSTWFGVPAVLSLLPDAETRGAAEPSLDAALAFCDRFMSGYTGMLRLRVIGETIISAKLRFSSQIADLYGPQWLGCVVDLYRGRDSFKRLEVEPKGFSIPVWLPSPPEYTDAPAVRAAAATALRGLSVSSVQVRDASAALAGDPGPWLLATVNGHDLSRTAAAAGLVRRAAMWAGCGTKTKAGAGRTRPALVSTSGEN